MEKNKINSFLLGIGLVLIIWGVFQVAVVSFPLSLEKYETPWYYLFHQLIMLTIGGVFGYLAYRAPLEKIKKYAPFLFVLSLVFVLFVFLPRIGLKIGGARRWINLGGIVLQPSEFLKLTFIFYLSFWLSSKFKPHKQKEGITKEIFLPFVVILLLLMLILLAQPDMSTVGIIFITGTLIYFLTPGRWWHFPVLLGGGVGGALLLIKAAPYRLNRFLVFLNPDIDPLGIGYQLKQSLIAVGSGKLFGIENGFGFGLSRQKFGFLPQPMTDSIFAIIGEELGFLGCFLLISLFILFAWQGLKIAKKSSDLFLKLLGGGITLWIVSQAFFNMAAITGILPLAGLPLPFFSYGGSHLIAELIGFGILVNISKRQP